MARKSEIIELEAKLSEEIDRLHARNIEEDKAKAVDIALKKRDWWWIKKLVTMCLVMWSSITYIGREVGGFLYDNYAPVRIGVDAAIAAWKARNG